MFKISSRTAFFLSLPAIIPLLLFCFDFFGPKKEIKSRITGKSSDKGHRVYFEKGMCGVSGSDYPFCMVGDTVLIKKGNVLKTVYGFSCSFADVRCNDYIYMLIMGIISSLSFFACSWSFLNKEDEVILFSDKDPRGSPIPLLTVSYIFTFVFIYLAGKSS